MASDSPVRVAVDVGSSGCKMQYARRDGTTLQFDTAYRFGGITTTSGDRMVWDIDNIVSEIVDGLRAIKADAGRIDSLAIDATALGFGFVRDNHLLDDPYFYLDPSLYSMETEILERISRREVFRQTGHRSLPNPYYYLFHSEAELFEAADSIVPVPQILSMELGAEQTCEETYAMTLYMFDARSRDWSDALLDGLALPTEPLPEASPPGQHVGTVSAPHADRLSSEPDIFLPPSHDTASAMAALPLLDEYRTFLATGSWFIPGLELGEPIVSDRAFEVGASNELSVDGKIRFLRNMPGFSLLEHCRETWKEAGLRYEYEDLLAAVEQTEPRGPLIDPFDDLFFQAQREGGVVSTVRRYAEKTGQTPPEGEGELTRCLLESLAARSATVIEALDSAAPGRVRRIHLCGGGVRNEIFCQMVASASGRPVKAGPVEATAIGNGLSQMVAAGEIPSYRRARELIDSTVDFDRYEPQDRHAWTDTVERMRQLSG